MKLGTTDLRVYKTRSGIKESLIELLEEKPLSEITVTELSSRAVINRKTFYRHYQTINDVVLELEADILEEMLGDIRQNDIGQTDTHTLLRQIGRYIRKNADIIRKITYHTPDILSSGHLKDMLLEAIMLSVTKYTVNTNEKEQKYIADFMLAGVTALYIEWYRSGCPDDEEMLSTAERLIASGISSYLSDESVDMTDEAAEDVNN